MIKQILNWFYSLHFYIGVTLSKVVEKHRTRILIKRKASLRHGFDKNQRARYLFHSMLKEGDQYRIGNATVTLMKFGVEGKEQVATRIAQADARREGRRKKLTEKGEEIMLLPPEKLLEFQVNEWLETREKFKELQKKFPKLSKEQLSGESLPAAHPQKDSSA